MGKKKNAYLVFIEEQERAAGRGGRSLNIQAFSDTYGEQWKRMTEEEKEPYKQMANNLNNGRKPNKIVIDIQPGPSNFAKRAAKLEGPSDVEVEAERQEMEDLGHDLIQMEINGVCNVDELLNRMFTVITFNIMMMDKEGNYYPNEYSLAQFTINDGIVGEQYGFIDAGPVPEGWYGRAKAHYESTHKIPFDKKFSEAGGSGLRGEDRQEYFSRLFASLMDQVGRHEPFIVYNLGQDHLDQVSGSMEALVRQSLYDDQDKFDHMLRNFFCFELSDLMYHILRYARVQEPFELCHDHLNQTCWDYAGAEVTDCFYHYNLENNFCARGRSRRLIYKFLDYVCRVFNVPLTANHMPVVKKAKIYFPADDDDSWGQEPPIVRPVPTPVDSRASSRADLDQQRIMQRPEVQQDFLLNAERALNKLRIADPAEENALQCRTAGGDPSWGRNSPTVNKLNRVIDEFGYAASSQPKITNVKPELEEDEDDGFLTVRSRGRGRRIQRDNDL